ncbi:MAG: permease-like cell division protein FtsX [Patescibacteria group bacterium]
MISFFSQLKSASENLVKHWAAAVPTILVMAITLTMFHGLMGLHARAAETLRSIEQKFSFTVYLKDDADPFEVGNVITSLENRPDVVSPVAYTSKEAAWQIMSKTFALDSSLLQKYKFSLPASLTITPRSPRDAPRLESFLKQSAGSILKDTSLTQGKQQDVTAQTVEFLEALQNSLQRTVLLFVLFFVLGGSLLMVFTIHLAMSSRHLEVSIMKLVGAVRSKMVAPFVIEGILMSLAAFLLHLFLLMLLPVSAMSARMSGNLLLLEFLGIVFLSACVSHITANLLCSTRK